MKSFCRAFRVDLRRSLKPGSFLTMVLLFFLLEVLNTFDLLTTYLLHVIEWPIFLINATNGIFSHMLFCVAAAGYAWSYCMDHKTGFFKQAVQRVGIRSYCLARVTSVVFTAFLAMFLATGLYTLMLLGLGCKIREASSYSGFQDYAFLVGQGNPFLFFLVRTAHISLTCGLAASVGLAVSAVTLNTYFSVFSPLLFYMVADVLSETLALPNPWTIRGILLCHNSGMAISDFFVSAGWILLGTALAGAVFYGKAERRR